MGKEASNLGKVVKDVTGYKVRIMLVSKSYEVPLRDGKVRKESKMCDSGIYGLYAGRKKLIKTGFKTVAEATEYVATNLMNK